MLAVDTNVIVRYLTRDDPVQSLAARSLVETDRIFVSTTVLLEVEWVLRGGYKIRKDAIVTQLRAFAGLPGVVLENGTLVEAALALTGRGLDFADALHFAATDHCDAFLTFDRRFATIARTLSDRTIRAP